jgi:hypothetical protein
MHYEHADGTETKDRTEICYGAQQPFVAGSDSKREVRAQEREDHEGEHERPDCPNSSVKEGPK